MALEKIKGEKAILALKPGAGRLNDGGGRYLAPFAWGQSHYWRLDYSHHGRRRTLSLGVYPEISLSVVRAFAREVRAKLASGVDPMDERQQQRTEQQIRAEEQSLIKAGLPLSGSFESVARRWFSVKKHGWMQSYSSKVIRRLELHAFPRFGSMPIGQITPKTVLEACLSARKAIENMPSLPPTPTGQPLVFERTISFTPFASDGPPSYSNDCRPDPPAFRNQFACDGQSLQNVALPANVEKPDPLALEDCLRQLPQGSVEAETARDKRAMERWGWK